MFVSKPLLIKNSILSTFTFLYLPHYDNICHSKGVKSKESYAVLDSIQNDIFLIRESLPKDSKLIVTSLQIPNYTPYGINDKNTTVSLKQIIYEINNIYHKYFANKIKKSIKLLNICRKPSKNPKCHFSKK